MTHPSIAEFDHLLHALTTRQHLSPHESLRQALARLVSELNICPLAIEQSLAWLALDGGRSIGRLRRTEIMQLARTIHRVWQQRVTNFPATASP